MSANVRPSPYVPGASYQPASGGRESANLGDILERVLDRGVVIAGDIQVNLLDIELLTIKLRLLIASVDTAREMGIDWWEHDPWLTGDTQELAKENRKLRRRLAALEEMVSARVVEGGATIGHAPGHVPEVVERGH
ncbi:gas vesicle protein GvpJ [Nonomuraea sp. NPDC001831]|uniref:gas vesicle protein GvpJ n=1 Tax=Nonomuraea sp. NPDC001831 TaxID=3364340 RepID=UPI0036B43693